MYIFINIFPINITANRHGNGKEKFSLKNEEKPGKIVVIYIILVLFFHIRKTRTMNELKIMN